MTDFKGIPVFFFFCIGDKYLPVFQESDGLQWTVCPPITVFPLPLLLFQSVVRSVGGNLMSMGIESGQDRRSRRGWKNVSQERPHPEGSSFNGKTEQGSLPVVDLRAPPSVVRRLQIIMEIVSLRLYYCEDPSSFAHSIFPFFSSTSSGLPETLHFSGIRRFFLLSPFYS